MAQPGCFSDVLYVAGGKDWEDGCQFPILIESHTVGTSFLVLSPPSNTQKHVCRRDFIGFWAPKVDHFDRVGRTRDPPPRKLPSIALGRSGAYRRVPARTGGGFDAEARTTQRLADSWTQKHGRVVNTHIVKSKHVC